VKPLSAERSASTGKEKGRETFKEDEPTGKAKGNYSQHRWFFLNQTTSISDLETKNVVKSNTGRSPVPSCAASMCLQKPPKLLKQLQATNNHSAMKSFERGLPI